MSKKSEQRMNVMLEYVKSFIAENKRVPSYREINMGTGLPMATISSYVNKLKKDGSLEMETISGQNKIALGEDYTSRKIRKIPIVGKVEYGKPVCRGEDIIDWESVSSAIFGSEKMFIVRASDNGLADSGIFEGDKVVVRPPKEVEDGDFVLAAIEGSDKGLVRIYSEKEPGKAKLLADASISFGKDEFKDISDEVKWEVVGIVRETLRTLAMDMI